MLLFTASGTGAFESAVVEPLLAGRPRARRLARATFGERWAADGARRTAATSTQLRYAWGETPQPGRPRRAARARSAARRSSSSTTPRRRPASSPTSRRSSRGCAEAGALVVVDAVSSLGAVPLETDAWGLDVVVAGSQKALMTPPGPRVRRRLRRPPGSARESATLPRFYFDWERTRARPGEGLDARSRPRSRSSSRSTSRSGCSSRTGSRPRSSATCALGRACRAGVKAMGLELFSPDEDALGGRHRRS